MRSPEEIRAEIEDLNRRLAKREGKPGFKANVEAIRQRIAEISAELDNAGD